MKQASYFKNKSNLLRYELFKKMSEMQQGHPGSIFSILDFLTVLFYGNFINYSKKKKIFTDRIILSKGHATSALYPILRDFGVISKKDWDNWGTSKKSKLRVFGNNSIPGIDVTSGSLGHGLGIGAGLAMSTMDIIKLHGGEPANFLDVGGGATADQVSEGFRIILSDPEVKAIFVNIFGGIMRCDILAQGVLDAAREINIRVPLVVRLAGTNFQEGKKILDNSDLKLISAENLDDAAKKIVEAIK